MFCQHTLVGMKNNQVERVLRCTAARRQKTGHFALIDLITDDLFFRVAEDFTSLCLPKARGGKKLHLSRSHRLSADIRKPHSVPSSVGHIDLVSVRRLLGLFRAGKSSSSRGTCG